MSGKRGMPLEKTSLDWAAVEAFLVEPKEGLPNLVKREGTRKLQTEKKH